MGYVLKEDISMDLTRQEKSLLLYMEISHNAKLCGPGREDVR